MIIFTSFGSFEDPRTPVVLICGVVGWYDREELRSVQCDARDHDDHQKGSDLQSRNFAHTDSRPIDHCL